MTSTAGLNNYLWRRPLRVFNRAFVHATIGQMGHSSARLVIFGGDGYGPKAHWPKKDKLDKLIENLNECAFNAVMFDREVFGSEFDSLFPRFSQAGLAWIADLSFYVEEDGYEYGEHTKQAIAVAGDDAWGYHISSQVSTPTNVAKIANVSKKIHEHSSRPTLATFNPDRVGAEVAKTLAENVDYVGVWTTDQHFTTHNAAVSAKRYRNVLATACKDSKISSHFYFKLTVRKKDATFLRLVNNYLVTKSIQEEDVRDQFRGMFWTTYKEDYFFEERDLNESAKTIGAINKGFLSLQYPFLSGTYKLRADNGRYWRRYGQTVNLNSDNPSGWDEFRIEVEPGCRCTIQCVRGGEYVSRFGDGELSLKQERDTFCEWIIVSYGNQKVSVIGPGAPKPYISQWGQEELLVGKLQPDNFCKFEYELVPDETEP